MRFPSITPVDAGTMNFLARKLRYLGFKCKILEFKSKNSKPIKNLYARLGNSKPKIQDEKMATYEGWCNEKHTKINWESNVEIIHNLIRGSDPQPGAHTIYNTKQIFIYGSKKIITNQTKKFGSVSSIEKEGIRIACKEGEILFEKVREKNEKKISAFEWSKISNLKIGDIFLNE